MLNINRYACTGRLTRDAEAHAGGQVVRLPIAVSNRYQDKSGEWKDDTAFLDVKVFGKAAERAGSLTKGQPVYVEGSIKQESWEKDGQKHSKLVVNASIVKPFEVPQRAGSGDSAAGYEPRPASSHVQQFSASENVNDDLPF